MVNVSNFKEFVEKINRDINEKYNNFSVNFAAIRKELRNQRVNKKECLFSIKNNAKYPEKKRMYYVNGGSQNEIQYHIQKRDCIYYGIGFSLKNSTHNFNTLTYIKPFRDVLFNTEFKTILDEYSKKGYRPFVDDENSCVECNINDFKENKIGKYYLFGKYIQINNDEISDEDYENMLNDFATDLFELYKKIFEERKKSMENKDIRIDKENDLLNKCQELLESNYNLILTGAPGTGKTYLAKQIAAKMIFGEDKNIDEMNDDEKAKFESQYKFVQFHPSYDYTDFVEGIRPVKEGNSYGFERKDGTFKEFCQRALYFATIISYLKEFCIEIEDIVKNGQQYITYDREDKEQEAKINQITIEDDHVSIYFTVNKNITILFNEFPNMYIRFCQTPINNMVEDMNYISGKNSHHTYYYGFLKTFYGKYNDKIKIPNSCNNENKPMPFVFVIDEINRGDINKILGELFYAIDLGYRGEKGKVETQYQNLVESGDIFENGFYIPENVYIIGTMNDIDRSVESMDFAIRRRFAWQEVKPEDTADEILKDLEIDKNIANLNQKAVEILKNLNNCIAGKDKNTNNALGEMYQIGASYFLKLDTYFKAAVDRNDDKEICIKEAYQKLWDNHLKGLIHEYVRGKKSGEEIFNKIKNKYFDLTGINCKENNEDTAE